MPKHETRTMSLAVYDSCRANILERAALELEAMTRDLVWSRDQKRALKAGAARLRDLKKESE